MRTKGRAVTIENRSYDGVTTQRAECSLANESGRISCQNDGDIVTLLRQCRDEAGHFIGCNAPSDAHTYRPLIRVIRRRIHSSKGLMSGTSVTAVPPSAVCT